MKMRWIVVFAASMALSSCSSSEHRAAAEQQADQFHRMFSGQQFEAIYAAAAPGLRERTPKNKFLELLTALHRKLGPVQSAKSQGWNVNFGTDGTHVTLSYETEFASGTGVETFVYRSSGSRARLVSYNINSRALITQ